ncbi:MAG: transposase family protein [Chloroflexota bacterium]
MTRESILELAAALRPRYQKATKANKKVILDEFCATTRYHRKAAIRLLNRQPATAARPKRRGRPRVYLPSVLLPTLALAWEASGFVCSKRLAPFMGELLDSLTRHHEIQPDGHLYHQLVALSPATIDRLLRPVRKDHLRQPHVSTPMVASLAHKVATHTYRDLRALPLGHLEIDLVLHCGMTTEGFHLTTLVGVDIVTGWCDCEAVWGKGQERVGGALEHLRRRLPFPLQGIHSDCGGEFINDTLYGYCQRRQIAFTHSRPYHKNDQPRVEQRNGSVVRQLIGHARYNTHAAHDQLNRIYALVRDHMNYFQPVRKLIGYERQGDHMVKRYDLPRTPYQRLVATGQLSAEQQQAMEAHYRSLNPLQLQRTIDREVRKLWEMEALDPASERAALAELAKDLPPLR